MSLKIFAVGDIMLGEQPLCENSGVTGIIRRKGAGILFEEVEPLFRTGDLVFGNLECSFGMGALKNHPRFFCADPAAVQSLKDAHFTVLSVANNHTMGNGRVFFQNTVHLLRDHGITPAGVRGARDVINVKGYRVAVLAYSLIEDPEENPCCNTLPSEESILDDIAAVRPVSDLVMVAVHWGCEWFSYPSPDQVRIGRRLVDAGADIVLGGHPHVTQSYEMYRNRVIIYSPGNFIFDEAFISRPRESFIAEIDTGDTPDSLRVNLVPVLIDARTCRPVLPDPTRREEFLRADAEVRAAFENRSLAEYQDFIGDYNRRCGEKRRKARRDMAVHFIKNLYRYSWSNAVSIVKKFFRKQKRGRV